MTRRHHCPAAIAGTKLGSKRDQYASVDIHNGAVCAVVHADDDSRGEESQVNQQDHKRRKSRVRNKSGDQFRRFSPYRPPRSELHFTVRTHPVVCANEGPAVGAHAAFIHALILQAGLFAPPLIKSRLPFCARYVV